MIYGNRNRFEFNEMKLKGVTTRKMCVFGTVFSRIWAEYGDMLRIQYVNYVQSLTILEKVPS